MMLVGPSPVEVIVAFWRADIYADNHTRYACPGSMVTGFCPVSERAD